MSGGRRCCKDVQEVLPCETFLIEVDHKWVVGGHRHVQPDVKLETCMENTAAGRKYKACRYATYMFTTPLKYKLLSKEWTTCQ